MNYAYQAGVYVIVNSQLWPQGKFKLKNSDLC